MTDAHLLRAAARPVAGTLLVLAIAMVACAALAGLHGGPRGVGALAGSAALTALVALALRRLAPRDAPEPGRREALVIVAAAWLACGVFGGLPFVLGAGLSPVDALFEAVSGFTTTGATILPEIADRLSHPLHLWRVATHWLGGLGIVVVFVALFPTLGVGGRHLFRTEAATSSHGGAKTPRIRDTARVLLRVYVLLTAVEAALLVAVGLHPFDALVHSLSTLGTGGFSNRNGSVGEFGSPAAEVVITVFMLLAGTSFGLFHDAARRGPRVFWRSVELRAYLGIFAAASLLVALDLALQAARAPLTALRESTFQVASILTTTGFGTADYEAWPALSQVVLLLLFLLGGCSGSTAGGMKIIRLLVILQAARQEVARSWRPGLVPVVRVGRATVPEDVVREALLIGAMYAGCTLAGGLLVALLDGVDPVTALSASLACATNVGPGFGAVGPTDHFGALSAASKLVLTLSMLLGRLEFLSLLALFSPRFWRR